MGIEGKEKDIYASLSMACSVLEGGGEAKVSEKNPGVQSTETVGKTRDPKWFKV